MTVHYIPERYHSVTPYITVYRVEQLIEFLKKVFGATLDFPPMMRPDGTLMHAEVTINGSVIMMGEPMPDGQQMRGNIYLYVPDIDEAYQRALNEGATSLKEPVNLFFGDRRAGIKDPFGNIWWIATHIEDVSPDEMDKRAKEFIQQQFPPKE